jgi:DNA (cytosine-5)-methyltransferase 1
MKYFDAFSGYGGFSLGIQKAYAGNQQSSEIEQDRKRGNGDSNEVANDVLSSGRTAPLCVGYSEVDKYAIQVYSKHFPTHTNYGDITKITAESLPDFDLLVGGFPCQAFSIAGKRMGFSDTRGTLFFDIARILKQKQPRLFVLENVKGLLSHEGGNTFRTIISTLDELGYDLQWQVLNSKDFGVPQNRERVFIIGHLRGTRRPEVFPIGSSNQFNTQSDGQGNAYCLQAGGDKHRGTYIRQLNNPTHSNNRLYGEDGISPALNTAQGGNRQPKICKAVLTPDRPEKRQNGRRIKEDGEPSFTLTGQDKHGVFDGVRIRRLTPTECERLMGLPDGWTEGVSDTQRYKLCGNGVVVNVVEEIINRLL